MFYLACLYTITFTVFVCHLFYFDISCRPSIKNEKLKQLSSVEIQTIKRYHIYLRYPHVAKSMYNTLNLFHVTSTIVAILSAYVGLWYIVGFLAIVNFIPTNLSIRLNPIFCYNKAINSGKKGKAIFSQELQNLKKIKEKIS